MINLKIKDLMKMRTSKKFIVQGVTFDMDHKLQFMLRSVPFGQHETYQKGATIGSKLAPRRPQDPPRDPWPSQNSWVNGGREGRKR